MENAADALKIGFALLVFVVSLSLAFMTIGQARETSDIITFAIDKTNFYPRVDNSELDDNGNRLVNADTVISSLYRCYNEGFCVIIQKQNGDRIGKFDPDAESGVPWNIGVVKGMTPWLTGSEAWNERINLFLNLKNHQIGTIGDYNIAFGGPAGTLKPGTTRTYYNSDESFDDYKDTQFKEEFIETTYNGKYVTRPDGSVITITPGGKKIYIYYTVQ